MHELVTINFEIYKPDFNENTDTYVDKNPYKKYQRKCKYYECRCKAGTTFFSNASFKQHIKSQTHKEFIQNYSRYYKEENELRENNNSQKAEIELLKRKLNNSLNENNDLKEQLDNIKNVFNNDEFHDCL